MKLIKMLGLTAVTAFVAMAFMAASAASAASTSLCSADENPCSTSNQIKHLHEVDPEALLLNTITGYIECIGLFLGDVLSGLAAPLHILGTFTYSSCEDEEGRPCTATQLSDPALISVLRTGTEKAEITGEGQVLVKCGFFLHCVYNGEGLTSTGLGALASGGTGLATAHNAVVTGILCPFEAELDVLYAPLVTTYIGA